MMNYECDFSQSEMEKYFERMIINNYSAKAKLYYSTILTEPEVNNCFSIITRRDLNRIRKETIKKRLVSLTGEFMREHEAVNSRCAKIFKVSSNMANDSFNLFVSSFVSFSINGLKENAENLNFYPILRRKVELYLFL